MANEGGLGGGTPTGPKHSDKPAPAAAPPITPGPVTKEAQDIALRILWGDGYLRAPAVADRWSEYADDALVRWQTDHGLPASGKLGADTLQEMGEQLSNLVASVAPPAAPSAPAESPAPATPGAAAPATAEPTAPAAAPNPDGKFAVPGGAQVWAAPDGAWYVVYTVPGTNPPVPLAWRIEGEDDKAAIFGPGNTPTPDRTLNADEWRTAGILVQPGNSRLLANLSEHPFDAFVANFGTEAKIRPWLRDGEILALTTRALLEGRTVTEAELASTEWWRSHTAGERAWVAESFKDPKTANQKVVDGRDSTRRLMIQLGVSNPPDRLVELIADRITGGTWTAAYAQNQIAKIADPQAPGALDPVVETWVSDLSSKGVTLNTVASNTDKVDQLIRTWVGPAFAEHISEQQRREWAGMLRNDPQAESQIVGKLRAKRIALFPEYADENLSYEDIASTWRGVVASMWGAPPDEQDPFFAEIVRLGGSPGTKEQAGGLSGVQQVLRTEGLKRGIGNVADSLHRSVLDGFGGGVRRVS